MHRLKLLNYFLYPNILCNFLYGNIKLADRYVFSGKRDTFALNFISLLIMEKPIKIILAGLFFLCLFNLPYGFYQFVRFAALIGFVVLAYRAYQQGHPTEMVIYAVLALLFQPIVKFALGRTMWNIVDVVVGLGLIASIWLLNNEADKNTPSQQ